MTPVPTKGSAPKTIVACASVLRPAERAIVRVSGPQAVACVAVVFEPLGGDAAAAAASAVDGISANAGPAQRAGLNRAFNRTEILGEPGVHAGSVRLTLAGQTTLVEALVLSFRAPRSYTGETLLEVHLPGAPLLVDALLSALQAAGAVPAEPGEFTRRAVLNGRMQLTEAEATLVAIHASDAADLRVGARLLGGETRAALDQIRGALTDLLADVEAGLDFSGEDIEIISDVQVAQRLTQIAAAVAAERQRIDPRQAASESRRELNGLLPRIALIGPTGAGKSTLFNRLLNLAARPANQAATQSHYQALTAAGPGESHTTRDVLTQELWLRAPVSGRAETASATGVAIAAVLGDLPGAGPTAAAQSLEREAIGAGLRWARSADVLVFVADQATAGDAAARIAWESLVVETRLKDDPRAVAWVWNKCDHLASALSAAVATPQVAVGQKPRLANLPTATPVFSLSAATGAGCDGLLGWLTDALARVVSPTQAIGDLIDHLRNADAAVARAQVALADGQELTALVIREALRELEHTLHLRLTPDQRTEAMLDRLFARFCLGK